MNDTIEGDLFTYMNESPQDEIIIDSDEPEKPFMEGVCPKCLDTGYVQTVKDGVLGLAFMYEGEEASGKRIKKLLVCGHGMKPVSY